MWELWKNSQANRCLPSELCQITGSVRRFYFDRGITRFGTSVEQALEIAEANVRKRKGKTSQTMINAARQQTLDKMLKIKPDEATKRYKDPAAGFTGRKESPKGKRITMSGDANEIHLGVDFLG